MWALIAALGLGIGVMLWWGFSRQSAADRPGTATSSSAQAVVSTPVQPSPPSPPKPTTLTFEERRAAVEAVTALRALKSATSVGVVYSEYMRRLVDAKIVVDRSSSALVKSPLRAQSTT